MRIAFTIARVLIQSALTQLILFVYGIYTIEVTALSAIQNTAVLVAFLAVFQVAFGLLFMHISKLKILLIPLLTSLATAAVLTLYPGFGFSTIDFWALFGILLLAGIISYVLLFESGAPMNERKNF